MLTLTELVFYTSFVPIHSEPAWEFMKKLEDVEGQERQKAMFECDVSDPEAEVKWFRDEKVKSEVIQFRHNGGLKFVLIYSGFAVLLCLDRNKNNVY